MSRVGFKDTRPEMVVRKLTHAMGYRYRLHDKHLPGRPDLVFRPKKKVIFVNGCFWHGHDDCSLARIPKSNVAFWQGKIKKNRNRDLANQKKLSEAGWQFMVVWECELKRANIKNMENKIKGFLDGKE